MTTVATVLVVSRILRVGHSCFKILYQCLPSCLYNYGQLNNLKISIFFFQRAVSMMFFGLSKTEQCLSKCIKILKCMVCAQNKNGRSFKFYINLGHEPLENYRKLMVQTLFYSLRS